MTMANLLENNKSPARSVSLPSRSHSSTTEIEQKINDVKSLGLVQAGLSGLLDLYMSLNDVLDLASTQQSLSHHKADKCIDELLEGSVKLLDVCSITKDFVVQIKELVQTLQSSVRRRKGDSSILCTAVKYTNLRKKMKKEARKLIVTLKQMANNLVGPSTPVDVIKLLSKVYVLSICILQSLLSFLSTSKSSSKQSKWSLILKLVHKGKISHEENKQGNINELADVDASLLSLCKLLSSKEDDAEKFQVAKKQLEALQISIGSLEDDLEDLFRRLIKTRASLLNILSQ